MSDESNPAEGDRRRARREVRAGSPGWLFLPDGRHEVFATDVSTTGAAVLATEPLDVGLMLLIRLGLGPFRSPRRARVVRCSPDRNQRYLIGLEFLDARPNFLAQERLSG